MKTENNMWSVVIVLSVLALLVLGSFIMSPNIYDVIYFSFLIYGIFRFIYLRKSNHGLNNQQ